MSLTINHSRKIRILPALLIGSLSLFVSIFSAQASTPDQFAVMQSQLMLASAQLEQIKALQPTGAVLGASTTINSTSLASLKDQLTSIDNQIKILQLKRLIVVSQIDQLQASSTYANSPLVVNVNAENPLATTLALSTTASSDWMNILTFDIDNKNGKTAANVDTIQINVTVGKSQGGFAALVSGAVLEINGITNTTYKLAGVTTANGVATLTYTVRGNSIVKADERTSVKFKVRFKALSPVNEGATLQARVLAGNVTKVISGQATGLKSVGVASGEVMTLRTKGMLVARNSTEAVLTSATQSGQHDSVTYTIKFDVTAFNQDVYLAKSAAKTALVKLVDVTGAGVNSGVGSTTVSALTGSGASDSSGQYYVIKDGTSATFTLVVNWTPGRASAARALQLLSLKYANTPMVATSEWIASPAKDFRTDAVSVIK